MHTPQAPKGTRDFYPEDYALREHIFRSWEKTCRRYGFERYDAPMFESLELYTQKSGEEVEKQLYAFKDKAGRDLALRPEITPSLARMVAARGGSLKMPLRWYSIPTLFRYERMQKGRLREFAQLNMDIVGIEGVSADAELIAAAAAMMLDLGFDDGDFSIRISSRSLLEEVFDSMGIDRARHALLYAALDKRHKISAEEFSRELVHAAGAAAGAVTELFSLRTLKDIDGRFPGLGSVARLHELFALLDVYGLSNLVEFDISIVRGLAYYTGIVFELFDKLRSLRAIAGGGRYDRLVTLYGGPDTPAVGFAAGDVVLGELLAAKNIVVPRQPRSEVFIVSVPPAGNRDVIAAARQFRDAGVGCEFALKNAHVGKQLKLADSCRARYVVFLGGDEGKEGKVKIKDMNTGAEWLAGSDNALTEIAAQLATGR